ncbi:M20/M25/M40 family metallo-hydrolase [Alkalihalobacillus sp. 1P02AB]|uniref:M20/M25/M40 family metallo-hydrolase n=1 Tax=Alkalihalobacillus sp. 1P02AB TaxID=3132260 RepID=UPI0039A6B773
MHWQTKEKRLALLEKLVSIPSISRTNEEKVVTDFLYKECMKLDFFQKHPDFMKSCHFNDNSSYFSALSKRKDQKKTIILISHFDVVGVDDFGSQQDIAFNLSKMTEFYRINRKLLSSHAQKEMQDGDWVFGRGTMDMKAGLVVGMGILEKATLGEWDGNILLITVSDEEVGSKGMLHAVEEIKQLKETHDLEYVLCLNTESSFKENPYDQNKYLYTGTIGKLMPSFYFRGKETHVGEPFAGLNSTFMCSILTNELELAADFQEEVEGEKTPVLTNLMMRDLKQHYNVQTPVSSVSMFNLLYMEESLASITNKLLKKTNNIAEQIMTLYKQRADKVGLQTIPFKVQVFTWEELYKKVSNKIGIDKVNGLITQILEEQAERDEREVSLHIVHTLSDIIDSESPMIILYFSPPFYPAVSSRNNQLVKDLSMFVKTYAKENHQITLENRCFFQGLSDLSYVSLSHDKVEPLTNNMPLFGNGYDIPFETIKTFDFPVMNIGGYGCDPHQKTERLELDFSFQILPDLLEELLKKVFE